MIRIVFEHPRRHLTGTLCVPSRAESVGKIETEVAQLRIAGKRVTPDLERMAQIAPACVQNPEVSRDHCAFRSLEGPLVETLRPIEVTLHLIQVSEPGEHIRIMLEPWQHVLQQAQRFTSGELISA